MPSLALLLLSLLPLALAPLMASWARRSPSAFVALDAFVAVTIAGVAVSHILPEAYHQAGPWALVVALVGFFFPIALHMGMHRLETKALPALVAVVLAGLAVHAMGDGAALVDIGHGDNTAHDGHAHGPRGALLPVAVLLHRVPVALAIWWFARPVLGIATAIGFLTAIGLATLTGYVAANAWLAALAGPQIALVHAFVVGMLFHVLLGHHRPTDHGHGLPTTPLALGGATGVALLVAALVLIPSAWPAGLMRMIGPIATFAVVGFALASRAGRGIPHAH